MNKTNHLLEICCISSIIGIISRFFVGLEVTFCILLVLIILDTVTGVMVALKNKRFSSRGFAKCIKKLITYSVAIMTVRLLEMGTLSIFHTSLLTRIMVAFLEVTEAFSILENLTLMDAPLPANFTSFLLEHLRIPGMEPAKKDEWERDIWEIEDIIENLVPMIKNEEIRRILEIKFQVWRMTAFQINHILIRDKGETNEELIYYKVLTEIELGYKEMEQKWKEARISRSTIEKYSDCWKSQEEKWLGKIKTICFSQVPMDQKREQIIDSLIVLFYKILSAVRRGLDQEA
ncbi:MAG: hypothetical protein GX066_01100 [Clostridiaceae bacterium]|nr:hypothetical protein [Clostridiaceae bacterium]